MRPSTLLPVVALGCTPSSPPPTLRVLAAASLSDVFAELGTTFESTHPGTRVELVFAGSQTLAMQVRHGLEADTLASADARTAQALATEQLVEPAAPFATGTLVLAVPDDTPPGLDLPTLPTVERLVLGTAAVPIGHYADLLLDAAEARYGTPWRRAVEARVVSREPDARKVAAKVALGEADAALVYATDLRGLSDVRAIPLPPDLRPTPTYVQARLRGAPSPALAADWLQLIQSDTGRRALSAHGFDPAPP